MNWYKVKTALIVLFTFINVFLVTTIIYNRVKNHREEQKLRETTVSVLEKNNISMAVDRLPEKSNDMRIVPVVSVTADKQGMAESLTGIGQPVSDDGVYAEYVSGGKKLTIKNTFFHFEDSSAEAVSPSQDVVKSTTSQLAGLGFNMEHAVYASQGEEILYTIQIDGKKLFANGMRVVPGKNGPASISGNWVEIQDTDGKAFPVRPAHEALLDFLRDPIRPTDRPVTITAIELGYSILMGDENVNYITSDAVPTWRIETNGKINFYYDARPK